MNEKFKAQVEAEASKILATHGMTLEDIRSCRRSDISPVAPILVEIRNAMPFLSVDWAAEILGVPKRRMWSALHPKGAK
jgi:hypothetical protein